MLVSAFFDGFQFHFQLIDIWLRSLRFQCFYLKTVVTDDPQSHSRQVNHFIWVSMIGCSNLRPKKYSSSSNSDHKWRILSGGDQSIWLFFCWSRLCIRTYYFIEVLAKPLFSRLQCYSIEYLRLNLMKTSVSVWRLKRINLSALSLF